MYRLPLLFALVFSAVLAFAGPAAASQPALLFSVASKDVRVTGTGKTFTVSVPANAGLAWFTDRPARRSGTATAAALVDGWQANGFAQSPPNAALVTTAAGTTMQTIVVLRAPQRSGGRVTFRATVLPRGKMLGMRTTGRPAAGRYAGELFVDDATVSPCSTGVTYVGTRYAQCYTTARSADYTFNNGSDFGTQTIYACGAGLSVHHNSPAPNTTYALSACPTTTWVGASSKLDFSSPSNTIVAYAPTYFLSVPAGVTFTFSIDPLCGVGQSIASGQLTCFLPAGSTTYLSRPTDGNTRVNACSVGSAGSLTYDSTASGTRGNIVQIGACDDYTPFADVPTTVATVVVHANSDTKLLLNAG